MAWFYAFKVVRHRGPAVKIKDGELYFFAAKPIALDLICAVSANKLSFLHPRPAAVVIELSDGRKKQIQGYHLKEGVEEVAERLRTALRLGQLTPPPLS